ncbi:hypothetical protein C8J57DRAFT_1514702 [Mycena rebaudengoi]|nr:hypothetical protein C8J57DRAFT_1514702 [Mycena rebaudengoi]
MDCIRNDDDEDLDLATQWDPAQWISCNKKYEDLPPIIEVARRNTLKIPPSLQPHLPPKSMSILQLMRFDMPPVADDDLAMDVDYEIFSTAKPTADLEENLPFLVLPSRKMPHQMFSTFGQAWFDGNNSLHTICNPDIAYPFWSLTYWSEMLDACEAKAEWLRAEAWLKNTGKTAEEIRMKQTVLGLWSVGKWHGCLQGFGSLTTLDLSRFFSSDYLSGDIVNAMLQLLSLRLTASGDHTALITNTTFAQFVRNKLEIGAHAHKLFEVLYDERDALATAVVSLNTVRRKGKANINILELDEDAEDAE